ncbi:hypothetical protein FHS68_001512 [Dyadobacter arcticus]|uniref:Uncharacterized protein n=1 Tax=Dyadobacter arcticus TaxID=1078754 RepID=A0ABX0UMP8_9BACT|nr:hypothetical protein [Dyadobacter arcticus]
MAAAIKDLINCFIFFTEVISEFHWFLNLAAPLHPLIRYEKALIVDVILFKASIRVQIN